MLSMHNVGYSVTDHQGQQKNILNNLNLHISRGEFVSIIGGNGAGKSTLLKLIRHIEKPTSGTIKRDYGESNVASVVQDYKMSTFDHLTLRENLHVAFYIAQNKSLGLLPKQDDMFLNWLSKLNLGLENKIDQYISSLSGGQRQAVSVVMSLMRHPHVLLLDEHTSALDPVTAKHLMELSYTLAKENNVTTIMVTHNLQHAAQYSDRFVVIKNGSITNDLKKVPMNTSSSHY